MDIGQELQPVEWSRTEQLKWRLQRSSLYEEPDKEAPHGYFAGRRIIGRDTPINKGVYLGSGQREAIVVDDEKYPHGLHDAYNELREKMRLPSSQRSSKGLLELVYDIASVRLGGVISDEEFDRRTQDMRHKLTGHPDASWEDIKDVKVTLNDFIHRRAGICRHRALLTGYLLERLVKDKFLKGKVSVDRNSIPGQGGHAWVRYEAPLDQVFIIDPSLGYVGEIQDAPKPPRGWLYERPRKKA